jgi:hypothetical protein
LTSFTFSVFVTFSKAKPERSGFEENLRAARGKKARGAAKAKAGSQTFGELQDKH